MSDQDNFSLQYQYNIKQISDENKEKYQFGDNYYYKALYPHTFSYPDPPSPDPILESGELQSSCSLPMTLICTLLNPLPATCELNPS